MYSTISIIDRLPGEGRGSMSPSHEPIRIRKSLHALEKVDLAEKWVPAFAGKTTKRICRLQFFYPSDHATFCQDRELPVRQSQFVAKDFRVVLADQRRSSGDPPGRAVIDGRLAWIDEAATQLRVLHLLPETAIMQVGIVKQFLRSAHRAPGEAAFLGSVVNLLCRQAGNEIGDQIIN